MLFAKIKKFLSGDLRRSYALRFTDGLATTTLAFAIPLMIYNATQSLAWSGLAFLIEWLPRIVSIPAAGPLVDKFGSKVMFITADSGRFLILLTACLWLAIAPHAWPVLLGVAILTGMLAQVSFVAAEHLGVKVPTEKSHHHVQSVQVGIDQTVMVLGPMLAGILLFWNNVSALAGVGFLAAVSVVLATQLKQIVHERSYGSISAIAGFKRGMTVISQNPTLQFVVLGTAAFNILLALVTVVTPAVVKGQFHGTDAQVSLLWAGGAFVSIMAVTIASRLVSKVGIITLGCVSGIIASGAAVLAGFADSYLLYAICVGIFLAMDGVYAIYIRTARARLVPLENFGVTVGVIVLFSLLPFPIAGALIAIIPPSAVSTLLGMSAFLCCVVAIISYIRIDHTTLAQETAAREAI